MITLKVKYHTDNEGDMDLIRQYQRQYTSLLKWMYNRCVDGIGDTKRKQYAKTMLNNIPLMECWFMSSASKDASAKHMASPDKIVIFGGRNNFIKRCKNKITHDEWKELSLMPLCSIGEANQKGNRKFKLSKDIDKVTFKPTSSIHIELFFNGLSKSYKRTLQKLYLLQETKALPITYSLDLQHIYIAFDEKKLSDFERKKVIKNRVMAIDLNPNYIGWSVVDWKSSSDYNVIKTGVYSIKELNDKDFSLKGKPSDSKERKYLSNKRHHEVMQISKNLINKALYYGCELFSMEELSINSSDKEKGRRFNKLCNNLWCRVKLVNNIKKRCNLFKIGLIEVKANYSSFVGNTLYRKHGFPDMVLASIEIGRRGYEFNIQHVKKEKETRKNIILPNLSDFTEDYSKSLEEFGISEKSISLVELYKLLKKSGIRYRLSFLEVKPPNQMFSSCFSKRSLILKIDYKI